MVDDIKPAAPDLLHRANTALVERDYPSALHEYTVCGIHGDKLVWAGENMTEKFTSEDLLILAHDEWKRREERKHIHDHKSWIAGFMGGFCTSKEWARKRLDKIKERAKL